MRTSSVSVSTRMAGVVAAITLGLAACSGGDTAEADAGGEAAAVDASHFEGETISIVHGFSIGGGYDIYARLIAEHLAEELGTEVIVVHEPGAGGLLATNQTWAAEADGTRITLINATAVLGAELAQADGVQYEAGQFGWVGRVSSEPNVAVTRAGGELTSMDQVVSSSSPIRFAATGPGSVEYIDPVFLREVFGLPIEVIVGFEGGPEAFQSVLAGDTDAQVRTFGSQLPPIEAGDAVPLLVIGNEVPAEIEGTPTIFDLETDMSEDIIQQHANLTEMGRALIAPPGMDEAVLQLLRDAYESVATDPEIMEAAAADGRPISFMSGADQADVVDDILGAPEEYVTVLREAFTSAG